MTPDIDINAAAERIKANHYAVVSTADRLRQTRHDAVILAVAVLELQACNREWAAEVERLTTEAATEAATERHATDLAVAKIAELEAENEHLRWEVECYEGMKSGVAVRIADLEARLARYELLMADVAAIDAAKSAGSSQH